VLRGRPVGGAALLGLSVAVKLVTVVALPWLVILRLRAGGPLRARLGGALAVTVVALAPVLLLQGLFGARGALVTALYAHFTAHAGVGAHGGALVLARWPLALLCLLSLGSCLWVWRQACVPAL